MKVTLDIALRAPGLYQWIGGVNPPIFTGSFEFSCEGFEFRRNVSFTEPQWVDIQEFTVRVYRKDPATGIWTASSELDGVSVAYFDDLAQRGWVLNPEAAAKYGFPNDEKDKGLQAEIEQHRKRHESLARQYVADQSAIDETVTLLRGMAEKAKEHLHGTPSVKSVPA